MAKKFFWVVLVINLAVAIATALMIKAVGAELDPAVVIFGAPVFGAFEMLALCGGPDGMSRREYSVSFGSGAIAGILGALLGLLIV